jgi:hypothetical protein
MREETFFIPNKLSGAPSSTLARRIPAIRLQPPSGPSHRPAKLGLIVHLPAGSNVQVCGEGFNHRTLKVRQGDAFYFVFQEDLAG